MSNFSMPWQIDILFSKFGWASNILSFVFNGMISPRVLLMWKFFSFFAKLTFSGKIFIALITITFYTYVNNFIFTKYLRLCNSLSNGRCVNIPTVSCGRYHCFHFTWMSLPAVFLCCTFIVVDQFIFVICSFLKKCHLGLSRAEKEATQLQTLPSVHELMYWPITDRLWKEWCQWHQGSWCIYVTHMVMCDLQS